MPVRYDNLKLTWPADLPVMIADVWRAALRYGSPLSTKASSFLGKLSIPPALSTTSADMREALAGFGIIQ